MTRLLPVLALLVALAAPAAAQSIWTDAPASRAEPRDDVRAYRLVRLDADALRARLTPGAARVAAAVPLPLPDGAMAEVSVAESPVMAPALQARYPEIRTYAASGPVAGRFSVTPAGFKALLYAPAGPVVIDPVVGDLYAVYWAKDLAVSEELLAGFEDDALLVPGTVAAPEGRRRADDTGGQLRTYRLAVAARGEFTQARSDGSVAGGLAAVAESVNRVNAIYERDMTVRFELVADNDQIIFTDPNTDPFTGRGSDLLSQNQTALDAAIGAEAYDIGHVLGFSEGGGVAYVGVTCNATYKAQGVSGVGNESSAFDLLVFPHELGHMLGAPHAFVDIGQGGLNGNGLEPGPGYTIMSYGHFAGYRPSNERVGFYFHGGSLDDMNDHVRGGASGCGVDSATGNDVPAVTAPNASVSIPVATPFRLEGSATDASGTAMTYVWEQVDRYGSGGGAVPLFRSVDPGAEPARFFPDLARELAGTPYPDETLPDIAATYTFRLTARDGVGGVGSTEVRVSTVTGGGRFALTSQTGPVIYGPGADLEVRWDVAGTDAAPFGVAEVDVLVSADGGATWTLAASAVPNNGLAVVTAPDAVSGRGGFVMVRPTDNVFYAISAAPFTIGEAPVADVSDVSFDFQLVPGASAQETLTVTNLGPAASSLDFDVTVRTVTSPSGEVSVPGTGFTILDLDDAGGPAADFQDISATGTEVSFSASDDGVATVALPFGFPFYGQAYSSLEMNTNGFVQFVGSTPGAYANLRIPNADAPNAIIAPFWDDLRIEAGTGATAYTGELADGRFVLQWTEFGRYVSAGTSGASYTFQLVLAPDGTFEFQYGTMTGPSNSATVGIENADGTSGYELAYNRVYTRSDFAVRFEPVRTWLTVVGGAGTLAGGAASTVQLVADTRGLADGDRVSADVVLRTNDGARETVSIPVEMLVTNNAVAAEDGPAAAVVSLLAPNPASSRAALTVSLAQPGAVRATLHDVLGRQVAVLHDGPAAGALTLAVDAGRLAAGAYVVRVAGEGFAETRRLVVAR